MTIVSVLPVSGSVTGGTSVAVTLSVNHDGTAGTFCRFGTSVVSGALAGSVITCTAPASAAGSVSLEVSGNDQDFTVAGNTFLFYAAPAVTSVTPNNGPTGSAPTLTVTGADFLQIVAVGMQIRNQYRTDRDLCRRIVYCVRLSPRAPAGRRYAQQQRRRLCRYRRHI